MDKWQNDFNTLTCPGTLQLSITANMQENHRLKFKESKKMHKCLELAIEVEKPI